MAKPNFKVIGIPWHIGHQYELTKLPFIGQYDILLNPYRSWNTTSRPVPENIRMVTHYEPGKYDFAILHIDQQSIWKPELNEKWARIGKGRLYYEANQAIQDIPKIVINHMTPFHDHMTSEETVNVIKELVGENHMIVNSYEAAKQWGWGHTIIHGLEVDEWLDLPKEPRCITVISDAGMERAYRRIFIKAVARILKEMGVPFYWVGASISFDDFDAYREFVGRSLVFFYGAWNSPRPRARTEAMLSGCCVVTTPYQDADTFIKDGENGFLTSKFRITDPRVMDNPQATAELIRDLVLEHPEKAIAVGKKGKETARKLFNRESFTRQWEDLLKEVGIWET